MSLWTIYSPPDVCVAGRYVLGRRIGRGAVSTVWQATDALTGQPVAVKEIRLPPDLGDELAAVSGGLLRAVRAARRLVHPAAATVFDGLEEGGAIWVSSELVPARTLWELLAQEGPLTPRRAATIGGQVLAALGAAHHRGIVHHDVQPGNVLVQADGRARLVDFGGEQLKTNRLMAARRASRPVLAPRGHHGPEHDLRCLGATLLCALTGHPPSNPERVGYETAGDLTHVVRSLLAATSYARPDATELRERLAEVATGRVRSRRQLPARPAVGSLTASPEGAARELAPPTGPPEGPPGTDPGADEPSHEAARGRTWGGHALETAAAWLRERPGVRWWGTVVLVAAALAGLAVLAAWLGETGPAATATVSITRPQATGITPTGWQEHRVEGAGVTVALPPGWRRAEDAVRELVLEDPASGAVAAVTTVADPPGDLARIAADAERNYRGLPYRRIRFEPVTHLGRPAFLWELEMTSGDARIHAADLHVRTGGRVVVLSFQTPADRWDDLQRTRRGFTGSLRPS